MKDLITRLSDEDSPLLYTAVIFVLGLAGYAMYAVIKMVDSAVKIVDAAVGVCR